MRFTFNATTLLVQHYMAVASLSVEMRSYIKYLIIILFYQSHSVKCQQQGLTNERVHEIVDSVVTSYMESFENPSGAIVVVHSDSTIVKTTFGTSGHSDNPKLTDTTLFRIASLSKVFTTLSVLKLVSKGKLGLEEDISEYVGLSSKASLFQLLTHSAGVESYFIGATQSAKDPLVPSLADFFSDNPPEIKESGVDEINYSNFGMALVGLIVEKISGQTFYDYVEEEIMLPIGMKYSTMKQPYSTRVRENLAIAGISEDEGYIIPYPAGSMLACADDMEIFMKWTLSNLSKRDTSLLLSSNILDRMYTRNKTQHTKMPGVGLGVFEYFSESGTGYFHTGLSGHQSILFFMPESNVGLFMVMSGNEQTKFFRRELVKALFPPLQEQFGEETLDSPPYQGEYYADIFATTGVESLGKYFVKSTARILPKKCFIELPGRSPLEMFSIGDRLYYTMEGHYIYFTENGERMYVSGNMADPTPFHRYKWYESLPLLLSLGGSLSLILFVNTIVQVIRCTRYKSRLAWYGLGPNLFLLLSVLVPVVFLAGYEANDRAFAIATAVDIFRGLLFLTVGLVILSLLVLQKKYNAKIKRLSIISSICILCLATIAIAYGIVL